MKTIDEQQSKKALLKKFSGKDNYKKPKADYLERLFSMPDKALYEETRNAIWRSAYAANNPRSDYHWQCDATYDEWVRRGNPDKYSRAHAAVSREA